VALPAIVVSSASPEKVCRSKVAPLVLAVVVQRLVLVARLLLAAPPLRLHPHLQLRHPAVPVDRQIESLERRRSKKAERSGCSSVRPASVT
jgi:hypothetical protein